MMLAFLLAVIVGTWNGDWFPSGRAEHRANPEVEAATIRASGKMIARGLAKIDTNGTEDVILTFNEMRNREVADALVAAIGRTNLVVASISGYRRRDRFDYQQDFIATTLPVAQADWAYWEFAEGIKPPRGYAHAAIVVEPAVTAQVYAVHLKSNYGSSNPETAKFNERLRTLAMDQLIAKGTNDAYVIYSGDFNADFSKVSPSNETYFAALTKAGFFNTMATLKKRSRGTYRNRRYGNSTLDYVMTKGFELGEEKPRLVPNDELSDHWLVLMQLKPSKRNK